MSELKRCPFCGGKAEIVGSAYKRIICKGCEIEIFITDETVDKWNTRKPMENIVERLGNKHNESTINYHNLKDASCLGERHAYRNAIEIVKEEGE